MIVIVAGPTASGKTALSLSLAKSLNGEIINVDSVQLYKDFVVGSAAPSKAQQGEVPHHLIGVVDPNESFDVAQYLRRADTVRADIHSRNKVPIFVGGTSLYITGLLYGLTDLPRGDEAMRIELEKCSDVELYQVLLKIDPKRAGQLHQNDRVRVIRAIESSMQLGEPVSNRYALDNRPLVQDAIIVTPVWSREELYRQIESRTRDMIAQGLVEEVQAIVKKYGSQIPSLRSIGYAETLSYLEQGMSLQKLEETIAQNTRRFAKRQMTWLRNQPMRMGWKVKPADGDASIVIEGDTGRFAKPGRLKHFSAWDINKQKLIDYVGNELREGFSGVQMLFVPGPKVV